MLSTCYLGSAHPLRHIRLWRMLTYRYFGKADFTHEIVIGPLPILGAKMRVQVAVGTLYLVTEPYLTTITRFISTYR